MGNKHPRVSSNRLLKKNVSIKDMIKDIECFPETHTLCSPSKKRHKRSFSFTNSETFNKSNLVTTPTRYTLSDTHKKTEVCKNYKTINIDDGNVKIYLEKLSVILEDINIVNNAFRNVELHIGDRVIKAVLFDDKWYFGNDLLLPLFMVEECYILIKPQKKVPNNVDITYNKYNITDNDINEFKDIKISCGNIIYFNGEIY
jgi:hypothetical protein